MARLLSIIPKLLSGVGLVKRKPKGNYSFWGGSADLKTDPAQAEGLALSWTERLFSFMYSSDLWIE